MKPFKISYLDYTTTAHPELGPTNGVRAWIEVDPAVAYPDHILLGLQAAANDKIKSLLAAPKLDHRPELLAAMENDASSYFNNEGPELDVLDFIERGT